MHFGATVVFSKEPTYTLNTDVSTRQNVMLSFILVFDVEPTIERG